MKRFVFVAFIVIFCSTIEVHCHYHGWRSHGRTPPWLINGAPNWPAHWPHNRQHHWPHNRPHWPSEWTSNEPSFQPQPSPNGNYWPAQWPSRNPQVGPPQEPWKIEGQTGRDHWHCGAWGCHRPTNYPTPSSVTPSIPSLLISTPSTWSTTPIIEITSIVSQCEVLCPSASQYNPVCGTNNVTYGNIGRLQCAQICGVMVQLQCEQRCEVCNPANQTTPSSSERTPIPLSAQNCIASCTSTSDYLPVCGTDNITYNNADHLLCAKKCGFNVDIQLRCPCPTVPATNDGRGNDVTSTTLPPATSPKTATGLTSSERFNQCMKSCATTSTIGHVCGTDFETYLNIDRLNCAKRCGKGVELLCEKPCIICSRTTQTTMVSTTTITTPTAMSVEQCINLCPRTPGHKSICGTNNITYDNPEHLQCAQLCGESVTILCEQDCADCYTSTEASTSTSTSIFTSTSSTSTSTSPYTSVTITSTSASTLTSTQPSSAETTTVPLTDETTNRTSLIEECMETCPSAPENNPVCGSNNVTYKNPTHIVCAQICGEDVVAVWFSLCFDMTTLSTTSTISPITNKAPLMSTSTSSSDSTSMSSSDSTSTSSSDSTSTSSSDSTSTSSSDSTSMSTTDSSFTSTQLTTDFDEYSFDPR